ncbi:hypothetical protein Q4E93_18340 [Flavitalea sp. BT771]|nr:hypothetical protein [Flavitalea sp. BT771]MDO6432571.1 hypothetical protein [Flavitalea sp. BT771]
MNFSPFTAAVVILSLCSSASHSPGSCVSHISTQDTTPRVVEQRLNNPAMLQGIWAAVGEDNAAFVIKGSKINYPQSFRTFPFFLSRDTLVIQYDDYQGRFQVRLHTKDTLILIGDEKQFFYRFKR